MLADYTKMKTLGYDAYKKWLADTPMRINLFYTFPWYTVMMIYNRLYFCTPKISDEEWAIVPTLALEAEYYKNHLINPWFENDNLITCKKEFEQGRKLVMLSLFTSGGVFLAKSNHQLKTVKDRYILPMTFRLTNCLICTLPKTTAKLYFNTR